MGLGHAQWRRIGLERFVSVIAGSAVGTLAWRLRTGRKRYHGRGDDYPTSHPGSKTSADSCHEYSRGFLMVTDQHSSQMGIPTAGGPRSDVRGSGRTSGPRLGPRLWELVRNSVFTVTDVYQRTLTKCITACGISHCGLCKTKRFNRRRSNLLARYVPRESCYPISGRRTQGVKAVISLSSAPVRSPY